MRVIKNIFSEYYADMDVKLAFLIATVFGIGRIKVMPGTLGSFAGLFLCLPLHKHYIAYYGIFLILFISGVIVSGNVEKRSGKKDPSYIIIDEFACIFLVYAGIFTGLMKLPLILSGFLLFRIFDITKPYPIKRLESLGNGLGIMMDDLLAAVYSNIVLQILIMAGFFKLF